MRRILPELSSLPNSVEVQIVRVSWWQQCPPIILSALEAIGQAKLPHGQCTRTEGWGRNEREWNINLPVSRLLRVVIDSNSRGQNTQGQ